MKHFVIVLLLVFFIPFLSDYAFASHNPNLFVSAENPTYSNHFSGSMVIEVVINDPSIRDTGEGKGEPDVTINGKTLRMVQATDGNWYAYFAHVDFAKSADATVGKSGEGLDFGEFCSQNTSPSIFGISLTETDGFAIPRPASVTGSTNGNLSFLPCTTNPSMNDVNHNNVVRNPKSINTNPNIPKGQIGLDPAAWPLVQLFSFNDVQIQYNAAGGPQTVDLEYDEIPNISFNIDRSIYPPNSEVFLVINDLQLNQDPTDEDSWTFNIDSPLGVFYHAFDNSGNDAANGNSGLVNLIPSLTNIGFENNGQLIINLGKIMKLKTNGDQPKSFINDGGSTSFSKIATLVEKGPNSGIFESFDSNDQSIIGILSDAPRGQTGQINYNKKSASVLTGFSTASIGINEKPVLTIGNGGTLSPGTEYPVTLTDPDQNINSGTRDDLDVFRDTAIIPTITLGSPITLQSASDVQFHKNSPILTNGNNANSLVPDTNSDRLIIDTSDVANGNYEMFSLNLGLSASTLSSILLDSSKSDVFGTNWINYDFRSLEKSLDITDFSDTSFILTFGNLGASSANGIIIADKGDISSSQGFIQIDNNDVASISQKNGVVYLIVDFDSSNDDSGKIIISNESINHPIVFDIFSIGLKGSESINNSIYRFELEETQDNSGVFEGTFEYAVANQLNITDPNFIQTVQTIDDEIKIIVTERLVDEQGVTVSYSDIDKVGVVTTTSSKSDVLTHSGTVSTTSTSFRFGQPVIITLKDPDLNLKSDKIDIYTVIDDTNSPNVDTVGLNGQILLEIKLKDIRYKRCIINGIEHGGLASTGFTLVETGRNTGIFEGVFKMPNRICDKSGSSLISTAGGSLDVRYYDARDASGNPNIFSLLNSRQNDLRYATPTLSEHTVNLPKPGTIKEIILSGSVLNQIRGIPLALILTSPDGTVQKFSSVVNSNGSYRSVFIINPDSLIGEYLIQISYNEKNLGNLSFIVSDTEIPLWIKNNARWWSSNTITDQEFLDGIEHLIETKVISVVSQNNSIERSIPLWIKNNAKWWSNDQISDRDFKTGIEYLVNKGIIRV